MLPRSATAAATQQRRGRALLVCLLLLAPALISASLQDRNYLHLVEQRRRLLGSADAAAAPAGGCSGKQAGEPIEGQYIVVFDTSKVSTVAEGVSEVRRSLQAAAARPTAASEFPPPLDDSQPTTPADAFAVVTSLTTVPEPPATAISSSSSSIDGSSSSGRRRPARQSPYLGVVVQVPLGAAGAAVVETISSTPAVKIAVQDVCVRALDSQERFRCLPATMLASSIHEPVSTAKWDGCLTPNTFIAWWGERCGPNFNMVQWIGVYAFDKTTGARLASCVKQRPTSGAPVGDDLTFWLGGCGVAPAAVPSLPTRVCKDPYVSDVFVPAEDQGCMSHNFTEATQTLQMFHPLPGCGSSQPVNMTFRGQRCSSNNGTSGSSGSGNATTGILWQSAEPAAGSGLSAGACSMTRRTGTTPDDLIYNMDWFGSCGVPPARVQYMPRSECPAPPPPLPPSPSPRPEDQKALDRVPLLPNEIAPSGIRRVLGVTPSANNASTGLDTVRPMRPVVVAVMDSGVDCFHRDLNVVYNRSFVKPDKPGDPLQDRNGCWDVYDHGTNVAGIIGARNNGYGVVGLLPDTPIASLKILNWDGTSPTSAIAEACLWLLSNSLDGVNTNPDNATNAQVLGIEAINMSFGFPNSPYSGIGAVTCGVMQQLLNAGIIMAAAAGNEKQPLNSMLPAACEGVIAVTAMTQGNGTISTSQNASTWFSNYLNLDPGSPVLPTANKKNLTVSAPGEDVYSSCFQQANTFCERTGTSQATPHVVGMLARCLSGGRCTAGSNSSQSISYAIDKWYSHNLANPDYGYAMDPLRYNKVFYWGYLTCADVW